MCIRDSPGGLQSGDIRLFGDVRNGYGAVEIYSLSRGWQGICPDSFWSNTDAATVCQDLGYQSGTIADPVFALRTTSNNRIPPRIPPRNLYAASCPATVTNQLSLGVCSFQIQSLASDCESSEGMFAAVQCSK